MEFILVIAISMALNSGEPKTFEIKMPQENEAKCKELEKSFELNMPRLGAFIAIESKCLSRFNVDNPSIFT